LRYDLNRLCWPMELSWMVWFILVKNNLEEEEQARVLAWSYRRFNCCRFWIRSNENRNASKSGWTFVGLLKMNEEGDAKPDKFSIQMWRLWFIRDRVTWRTLHLKFMIFWEKVWSFANVNGRIKSLGPRYCPSIEDKINRFADKERHQLFVEPEGWNTCEVYVNGFSTSPGRYSI
jgi:hypothetical protein